MTALCAFNDEVAIGLIHAARSEGLELPAELAIIGVDNLPWGALTAPALTTVAPDPDHIGHVIADYVVAGITGSPGPVARPDSSAL